MMKILVISDTHGELYNLRRVLREVGKIDRVFMLGDCEEQEADIRALFPSGCMYFVRGNCDRHSDAEAELDFTLEGVTFHLTHGNGQTDAGIRKRALAAGASVICRGHTHRPSSEKEDGVLTVNPGSLSAPRQWDGIPTYAVITVENGKAEAEIFRVRDYI